MSATTQDTTHISSAEMTAYWRSLFPELSGDNLSQRLASPDGIQKSKDFAIEYEYPLISRKISVRAGYFLQEAARLLSTLKYDSCISFASGFSLLTYYIALNTNTLNKDINFFDTDLPGILTARQQRLISLSDVLNHDITSKTHSLALDLEQAYETNQSLASLFPQCRTPVFIMEGISYFLTKGCIQWLFKEIASFEHSALIIDYFPEDSMEKSQCFSRIFEPLRAIIPEKIKYFIADRDILALKKLFYSCIDKRIKTIEHEFSAKASQAPQFLDQNAFFPVHILTGEYAVDCNNLKYLSAIK